MKNKLIIIEYYGNLLELYSSKIAKSGLNDRKQEQSVIYLK